MEETAYIGMKIVHATPMTRGEYADSRGCQYYERPGEKREDEGYRVTYPDGYVSWCPKKQFEDANQNIREGMDFGRAIFMMKRGCKVARKGWNGKGQYIELATNISYKNTSGNIVNIVNVDYTAIGNMAIAFVSRSGVLLGWLASQSDMLSNDWIVVD